jgi:hypothetical protein
MSKSMRNITKTALSFDDGGAAIHLVDTIWYQGSLWLVAGWLENTELGLRKPSRIVRPLRLEFQPNPKPAPGAPTYSISGPVSKAVYEGRDPQPQKRGYAVVDAPEIYFPLKTLH